MCADNTRRERSPGTLDRGRSAARAGAARRPRDDGAPRRPRGAREDRRAPRPLRRRAGVFKSPSKGFRLAGSATERAAGSRIDGRRGLGWRRILASTSRQGAADYATARWSSPAGASQLAARRALSRASSRSSTSATRAAGRGQGPAAACSSSLARRRTNGLHLTRDLPQQQPARRGPGSATARAPARPNAGAALDVASRRPRGSIDLTRLEAPQAQGVGDDAEARERHRGARDHRVEQADRGQRDRGDVVAERPRRGSA